MIPPPDGHVITGRKLTRVEDLPREEVRGWLRTAARIAREKR